MPKTLPVLLTAAAVAALGFAAQAQTTSPPTPPAATTPPIVAPAQPPTKPMSPPAPVEEPDEVSPTQGDTVTTPTPRGSVVPATPAVPATSATPGESAAVPATPVTPAARPALTAGATVKDSQGNTIGTVTAVNSGGGNVMVSIDGKPVSVSQSVLTQTGDTVVSTQTKAQLLATVKPK
jgi:hypothetical protein